MKNGIIHDPGTYTVDTDGVRGADCCGRRRCVHHRIRRCDCLYPNNRMDRQETIPKKVTRSRGTCAKQAPLLLFFHAKFASSIMEDR